MITCTAAEYVEIESMMSIYMPLYEQELDIFYYAFCDANDLLIKSATPKDASELTDKEFDDLIRAKAMASKIKSKTYRKQISE